MGDIEAVQRQRAVPPGLPGERHQREGYDWHRVTGQEGEERNAIVTIQTTMTNEKKVRVALPRCFSSLVSFPLGAVICITVTEPRRRVVMIEISHHHTTRSTAEFYPSLGLLSTVRELSSSNGKHPPAVEVVLNLLQLVPSEDYTISALHHEQQFARALLLLLSLSRTNAKVSQRWPSTSNPLILCQQVVKIEVTS